MFDNGLLAQMHPNKEKYAHQKMYIIGVGELAYCVPFIEDENQVRLITVFPSRKYTNIYLGGH